YRQLEGRALYSMGIATFWTNPDEAIALFESGLTIHREVGDRRFELKAWTDLGLLYRGRGRSAEADACEERALAVCVLDPEIEERDWSLIILAGLFLQSCKGERAHKCLTELEVSQRRGEQDPLVAALSIGMSATITHLLGDLSKADDQ